MKNSLISMVIKAIFMSPKKHFMVPYRQSNLFTARDGPYGNVSRLMKMPQDKQVLIALRDVEGIGLVKLRPRWSLLVLPGVEY